MKKVNVALLTTGFLLLAANSFAITITESGDVGQTIPTASYLPAGTLNVTGTVSDDADLFWFNWGGGNFYANTVGSTFDSQLFLFDGFGAGIQGNDDGIAFAGPAYLQLSGLSAGTYFIGVSGFDYDPYGAAGLMFESYPYEDLYGPNNPGDPLTYWSGNGASGTYWINFQSITDDGTVIDENPIGGDPVPEPATMFLFGTGIAGLVGSRCRRKKK